MSTFIEEREQRRDRQTFARYEAFCNGDAVMREIRHGDELSLGGDVEVEFDRLLAAVDDDVSPMPYRGMSAQQRSIIAAGIIRNAEIQETDRERVYALQREKSRLKSRKLYAQRCAAEGRDVRAYTKHARIPNETPDERKTRLHREDSRRRKGKTSETVRAYERLEGMKEAERRDRKREQDAASKRRQRAARKQAPSPSSQKGAA